MIKKDHSNLLGVKEPKIEVTACINEYLLVDTTTVDLETLYRERDTHVLEPVPGISEGVIPSGKALVFGAQTKVISPHVEWQLSNSGNTTDKSYLLLERILCVSDQFLGTETEVIFHILTPSKNYIPQNSVKSGTVQYKINGVPKTVTILEIVYELEGVGSYFLAQKQLGLIDSDLLILLIDLGLGTGILRIIKTNGEQIAERVLNGQGLLSIIQELSNMPRYSIFPNITERTFVQQLIKNSFFLDVNCETSFEADFKRLATQWGSQLSRIARLFSYPYRARIAGVVLMGGASNYVKELFSEKTIVISDHYSNLIGILDHWYKNQNPGAS
jgi:hypothetical protein